MGLLFALTVFLVRGGRDDGEPACDVSVAIHATCPCEAAYGHTHLALVSEIKGYPQVLVERLDELRIHFEHVQQVFACDLQGIM